MDAMKILMGLVVAVLAMNLIIVGVYLNEKGVFSLKLPEKADQNATSNETVEEVNAIKTYDICAGLNGTECAYDQKCSGDWLDASDSFTCCSSECEAENQTTDQIEAFEPIAEEDLGEII